MEIDIRFYNIYIGCRQLVFQLLFHTSATNNNQPTTFISIQNKVQW